MRRPDPLLALLAVLLLGSTAAFADEVPGERIEIGDPVLAKLQLLERSSPDDDPAPLWDDVDTALQAQVEAALDQLELDDDVRQNELCVVLVDISKVDEPKVASVNGRFSSTKLQR